MNVKWMLQLTLTLPLTCFLVGCKHISTYQPSPQVKSHQQRILSQKQKPKSLWKAISSRFGLHYNLQQPSIQHEIQWFKKHQFYINELTHNANPYLYYVFQQTQKRHMPAELALLPMIESNYNPFQFSKRGAVGLWQMMPGTASGSGLTINWWYDGRRSIVDSTKAALDFLCYLHEYFGNWLLAIAAYDSGAGTVQAAISHNKHLHKPTDFWSLPLPLETKKYVPKFLALVSIIKNPNIYGIHLNLVKNTPYFKSVSMKHQIDFHNVAHLAKTKLKTIRELNPGFRRWATIPNQAYELLLPVKKAILFQQQLKLNKPKLVTWLHHRIQQGDTLYDIAKRNHTNTAVLMRVNELKSSNLQIGQDLLVPLSYEADIVPRIQNQNTHIAEDHVPGPKQFMHKVKPQESLWSIAAEYNVKPNEIRYWNDLGYHSHLQIGQQLVIWKKSHHYVDTYYQYHIRKGDSLSGIAKRFNVSVKSIRSLNHLNNNLIRVGKILSIPKPHHKHYIAKVKNQMVIHTVRRGESVNSIAKYFRVPANKIIQWNHLSKHHFLRVGESLRIYLSAA